VTTSRPTDAGTQLAGRAGSDLERPGLDLATLATRVTAALPRLDADERRVGVAVYALLAAGAVCSAGAIAVRCGLAPGRVRAVLGRLPTATVEDGAVTAFLGLRRGDGAHRVSFGGGGLSVWCAWDALFVPELAGAPALAESSCPVTGEPITVEVHPEFGVVRSSPDDALLSFLARPAPFAGDVVSGFCRWIHFLSGPDAARDWLGSAGGGPDPSCPRTPELTVISLDAGFALGRMTNAAIFGDARPAGGRDGRPEARAPTGAEAPGPAGRADRADVAGWR